MWGATAQLNPPRFQTQMEGSSIARINCSMPRVKRTRNNKANDLNLSQPFGVSMRIVFLFFFGARSLLFINIHRPSELREAENAPHHAQTQRNRDALGVLLLLLLRTRSRREDARKMSTLSVGWFRVKCTRKCKRLSPLLLRIASRDNELN